MLLAVFNMSYETSSVTTAFSIGISPIRRRNDPSTPIYVYQGHIRSLHDLNASIHLYVSNITLDMLPSTIVHALSRMQNVIKSGDQIKQYL